VLGVVRDITEQVQAYELLEQRVAERTHELSTLLDVSHNVASTLELQPLLGLILDQLAAVVEYSGAAIHTLDGTTLTVVDYRGPLPRGRIVGLQVPLEPDRPEYRVIHERAPVILDDVQGETALIRAYSARWPVEPARDTSYIRSWLGLPLLLKERLIGMMVMAYHDPAHYTPRHAQLAMAIANQAAIAIENAQLYGQAQEIAVLEERQRLARELHDSVSQALYGIALGARTARTLLDRDPAHATEPLDYVLALAEAGLAEMRALILELRPEALQTDGLVAALEQQTAAIQARHGIAIEAILGSEPEASIAAKEALYRIAQEALHNTVKHARARRVEVRLSSGEDWLTLEVRDDGDGFDPNGSFPGHLGLQTMRERAMRLGGTIEVTSAPTRGTLVRARIPHQAPADS
jgi:signal transduction histidine kinase